VRLVCPDVGALLVELQARPYNALRPSAERVPWGGSEIALTDPFGNRITFYSDAVVS
jgi:Glyoxalase superfamily protein